MGNASSGAGSAVEAQAAPLESLRAESVHVEKIKLKTRSLAHQHLYDRMSRCTAAEESSPIRSTKAACFKKTPWHATDDPFLTRPGHEEPQQFQVEKSNMSSAKADEPFVTTAPYRPAWSNEVRRSDSDRARERRTIFNAAFGKSSFTTRDSHSSDPKTNRKYQTTCK